MKINNIKLDNFKNHFNLNFDFSPKLNLFVGKNGVGKTNILDAIYYLCTTKSFITSFDINCIGYKKKNNEIKYNKDYFFLEGTFNIKSKHNCTKILFDGKKKTIKFNDEYIKKAKDYIGIHPIICISPDDIDAIKGSSEVRRKLFDMIVCQINHKYLDHLTLYNRYLKERNALLKIDNHDKYLMETYDKNLIYLSMMIYQVRKDFIKSYLQYFKQTTNIITNNNKDNSLIKYISHLNDRNFEENFYTAIKRDKILGYTTMGIHKDDYIFELQNQPLKIVASQGQKKSFMISVKIGISNFLFEKYNTMPIVLMDDIFEKLDSSRIENIINYIKYNSMFQYFITDTQKSKEKIFEKYNLDHKVFKI